MTTTRCGDSMFSGLLADDTCCELQAGHAGDHQATVQMPAWSQGGKGSGLVDTIATWQNGEPVIPGMTHHVIPMSACPTCGWEANRVSGPTGMPCPVAGDVSFCDCCAAILVFDDALNRRAVTAADMASWTPENVARVLANQRAMAEAILGRIRPSSAGEA